MYENSQKSITQKQREYLHSTFVLFSLSIFRLLLFYFFVKVYLLLNTYNMTAYMICLSVQKKKKRHVQSCYKETIPPFKTGHTRRRDRYITRLSKFSFEKTVLKVVKNALEPDEYKKLKESFQVKIQFICKTFIGLSNEHVKFLFYLMKTFLQST